MKTGIELIAEEREEQIGKHGRTVAFDVKNNSNGELLEVALQLLSEKDVKVFPANLDFNYVVKLTQKTKEERMIIAAALIAAEYDRLQSLQLQD